LIEWLLLDVKRAVFYLYSG